MRQLRRAAGFTLIERVPRVTHAATWWLKGTTPVNCSLQTGSLTAEPRTARSAVTKSPVGNSPVGSPTSRRGLVVSPSGEAKTQAVGKRTTAGIVKVIRQALLTEPGNLGSRSSVRWEKAAIGGVASGHTHPLTRRCKRWRHVSRVRRSNWGRPARFPWRHGITGGARRNAEGRGEAVQGIGDAHSSEDQRESTTRWERRGISRSALTVAGGDLA